MIYLDHAATTPLSPAALQAMMPFLSSGFANASAAYSAGRESRRAIDQARAAVASAIGAGKQEVYFTSGGSEADNWALFGAAYASAERKRIVTTAIEHHAILHACDELERRGFEVIRLPVDGLGRIDLMEARKAIDGQTLLVSAMLANNEVGTIEPIAELAELAHAQGALMHTDAVQAVGHIPVNVDVLNVDMLSMSAHKFGGPKGIGALYIRSGTRLSNLIYGGAQERGMRAGTENTAAIVGMSAALRESVDKMEERAQAVSSLRALLIDLLSDRIPELVVHGDGARHLPGILHLTIPGISTDALLTRLDMAGIAASAGSACAAGSAERSHVLAAMHLPYAPGSAEIRISLGEENTQEEIRKAAETILRISHRE